ncbi:ADP-ribosyl-(dinitrogen reductase) hydrolase [Aggregatibacter actinomycetemcomitans]|uniref:ADP-ribosyl-(dinitrogen reductase) hydrolase n=1 Tax=Aggregatibacter actinomycetemcomitans TaxID=714 RepID=UPI00197B9481|nr:ADP-ribosyl-(dinitrogen reductase) hydrolase [Aggregatibacter actinomycetemcomitans]MBN6074187.1 ADP-ribosyl-(dinitrogen reductase) hydrolase [Aggregatibacter actinomycetemcomitans]MBN6075981.1 ADP-ribosyl-(dinitrogen reductase) hydrolase [Aggregatibacter actinomycetemcomitans]
MNIIISSQIQFKLKTKHNISDPESAIREAFCNMDGETLIDTREDHASDPPTEWFISETNFGIKLKVCFIEKDGNFYIRTAYAPNAEEIRIYEKYGK